MGTLTNRIHRHDRYWVRIPPNRAPAAPPPAATALHTPKALARARWSRKVTVRMVRVAGREHGGAHPLEAAGGDQGGLVGGEAAEQAGRGEQREAEQEDPPSAEQVGQPPAEEEQAAEGQGVGGHHPLEARRR